MNPNDENDCPHLPKPLGNLQPVSQCTLETLDLCASPSSTQKAPVLESKLNQILNTCHKRARKAADRPRGHECLQCHRSYLSYSALYAHIKIKHTPKGEFPLPTHRSRGRPKKNDKRDVVDPASVVYFYAKERTGGPTAVLYGFKEAFDTLSSERGKYRSYNEHNLYIELYKQHLKNINIYNYGSEYPNCTAFGLRANDYSSTRHSSRIEIALDISHSIPENTNKESLSRLHGDMILREKQRKSCDAVFAEYLNSVARIVSKGTYADVLKFVLLFRECLNASGGKCKAAAAESGEEFCLANNAEEAPEAANEFVGKYLKGLSVSFGNMEVAELVQNLCGWLFDNGYTSYKICLIKQVLNSP